MSRQRNEPGRLGRLLRDRKPNLYCYEPPKEVVVVTPKGNYRYVYGGKL